MEYSVKELTKMSGVSARTLRYYHEIGLLEPARVAPSGYRVYGDSQVDRLQQILLYRELGFSLADIAGLVDDPSFDRARAFADHLSALRAERDRLDVLIANVERSIQAMNGEGDMTNEEKFQGFGRDLVRRNEEKYGAEARAKYGDEQVDQANRKVAGMTQEMFHESERLRVEMEDALKAAFLEGDPAGELAQRACDLHRQWLCMFYPKYTKDYHRGLAQMYVQDERFRANYDKLAPGCTEFLRDAVEVHCS